MLGKFLLNWCHPNPISNNFVPGSIPSCVPTKPRQHPVMTLNDWFHILMCVCAHVGTSNLGFPCLRSPPELFFLVKCNLLEQVNCKDQLMNDSDASPFGCDWFIHRLWTCSVVLHVGARWDLSFKFVAVQTLTSEAFTLGFDLAHHELNTERLNLVASGLGFVYHYWCIIYAYWTILVYKPIPLKSEYILSVRLWGSEAVGDVCCCAVPAVNGHRRPTDEFYIYGSGFRMAKPSVFVPISRCQPVFQPTNKKMAEPHPTTKKSLLLQVKWSKEYTDGMEERI